MSQYVQPSIQYSFPKAQRFRRLYSPCSKDYYEPNYFRNTRASGFGYGNKFDFTKLQSYTESYYTPISSFQNNQVPGPGSYDQSPRKTISYSIGQRVDIYPHTIEISGPGAYDPNINRKRSLSIGKGSERFSTGSSMSPGPGIYNAKIKSRCRFSSPKKKSFIDDIVRTALKSGIPGPGNYPQFTQFVQLNKQKSRPSTAKH